MSSIPGGDEQSPRGLRRAGAKSDGDGAVHADQLLAGGGVEPGRAVVGNVSEELQSWSHGWKRRGGRGARVSGLEGFGVCEIWGFFRKGLAVVEARACAVRTALCVGKRIAPRSRPTAV